MNMNLNREVPLQQMSLTNLWKKWHDTKLSARVRREKRDFCFYKTVAKKPKLTEKDSGHESASSSSAASAE